MATPEGQELSTLVLTFGYKLVERVQDLTRLQIAFLFSALNYRQKIESIISKMDTDNNAVSFIFP